MLIKIAYPNSELMNIRIESERHIFSELKSTRFDLEFYTFKKSRFQLPSTSLLLTSRSGSTGSEFD